MNPYIADILAQPAALRDELRSYSSAALDDVYDRLRRGEFDRIIISGMGSSYNAAYPGFITLSKQPVQVQLVNASELLHSLNGLIGSRTLLWLNTQSGRSAELVQLLEFMRARPPGCILAFVNDVTSPMASHANITIPIHAGKEATVSTKTYLNMLAANLLASIRLASGDLDHAIRDLLESADAMEDYLADWSLRVEQLDSLLGEFDELFLLGRGASMSAVWNGSLINKEAAKCAFEGLHAADFRHGPLELASTGFTAAIFSGAPETRALNRALGLEITSQGGRVLWIDSEMDPLFPTILLPKAGDAARPLLEILPIQLLTLVMAERKGLQAGQFRYVGKVTSRE